MAKVRRRRISSCKVTLRKEYTVRDQVETLKLKDRGNGQRAGYRKACDATRRQTVQSADGPRALPPVSVWTARGVQGRTFNLPRASPFAARAP